MNAAVVKVSPGANTVVMDEPAVAIDPTRRNVTYTWVLGPESVDDDGDVSTPLAVLSIYHWADRKAYSASLRSETVSHSSAGFTVRKTSFSLMTGGARAFSLRESTPRYNRKALVTFAEAALAALREQANEPGVLEVFGVEAVTEVVVDTKPDSQSTLDWLQGLVDGDIEPIWLDSERMEGYVNEDGKYQNGGLTPNPVATAYWFGEATRLNEGTNPTLPGEYIAGNLVVVGPLDDDGETTGVTDEVIAELRAFVDGKVTV